MKKQQKKGLASCRDTVAYIKNVCVNESQSVSWCQWVTFKSATAVRCRLSLHVYSHFKDVVLFLGSCWFFFFFLDLVLVLRISCDKFKPVLMNTNKGVKMPLESVCAGCEIVQTYLKSFLVLSNQAVLCETISAQKVSSYSNYQMLLYAWLKYTYTSLKIMRLKSVVITAT